MEKAKNTDLDIGLENNVHNPGYKGRVYTLYELRNSANNYKKTDDLKYREKIKKNFSLIYNCIEEKVPVDYLRKYYGLDENYVEEWILDKVNEIYVVSTLGRIGYTANCKKNSDGSIVFPGELILQNDNNNDGFLRMTKTAKNGEEARNTSTPVYQFIAESFYGSTVGFHVHHINNNGYDCRPENLILLNAIEHSKAHGWPIGLKKEDLSKIDEDYKSLDPIDYEN